MSNPRFFNKKEELTPSRTSVFARRRARTGISKTIIVITLAAVIAIAGLVVLYVSSSSQQFGSSSCSTGTASSSRTSMVSISILNGAGSRSGAPGYAPDAITVVVGVNNTVVWTNSDPVAHTVTSSSAPTCGSFNSGNMNQGQTYTHTFTIPGTYQYYCKYHSWMTGTIIVVAGS